MNKLYPLQSKNPIFKVKIITLAMFCWAFQLLSAQEVKINNNFVVEADGTIRSDNDASTWNDLSVFPDATNKTGANQPVWTRFQYNGNSTGVYLWMFDPNIEQEVFFTIQIPHNYKVGTSLKPHVHWSSSAGTPGRNTVVWGLEYTIAKIGGAFGTTSIVSSTTIIPSIGTISGTCQHLISSFPDIVSAASPNNPDISTVLICRLYRKATDVNDTFTGAVGLLSFDLHYESDTQGSRTEYTK